MIGRGKPLSARWADASIAGARAARRTGPVTGRPGKRAEQDEPLMQCLARMLWYARHRMPVVFARAQDYDYTKHELQVIRHARAAGAKLTFLEWTDDTVDRTAGPDLAELRGGAPG